METAIQESKRSLMQRLLKSGSIIEMIETARNEPKISSENVHIVKQIIQWAIVILGVKPENIPDEDAKNVLFDYMMSNMRQYSAFDIKNAISLYVGGKLDFNDPHFQLFSVLFLENVMQSYNRLRANLPKKPVEKLPEVHEPTPEEHEKNMTEGCLKLFENYKATGEANDYGNIYYDWLDRKGLINLSNKEKWQCFKMAEGQLKSEAVSNAMSYKGSDAIQSVISEIENNKGNVVINRAKKLALQVKFHQIVTDAIDFNQFLANGSCH